MENENYQDEFEQFLQEEVKQHRMYPSDHIWKNIRTEIHGTSNWPALTFISLFIITALTVSTLLINHPSHYIVKSPSIVSNQLQTQVSKTFMMDVKVLETPLAIFTQQPNSNQHSDNTYTDVTLSSNKVSRENTIASTNEYSHHSTLPTLTNVPTPQFINAASTNIPITSDFQSNTNHIEDNTAMTIPESVTEAKPVNTTESKSEKIISVDDYLKDLAYAPIKTQQKRTSKFGFQIYVTPSTSYRTLSDAKVKEILQPNTAANSVITQIAPLSVNYSTYSNNVNHVVRHRPAMGLELGFALLYNMSDRIKFKTGLQLNVRQYLIETFQSRTNDLTTLSIINQRGVETINFYSPYNNNTGYKQTELDNKVYQVSVPIGIQWDMIKGKHFGINTEASVQPTFTLNTNTYLLTTDYNHYTDGSDFIRKWNINSSAGINLTYKSGTTSWQIGPQIRYQHLPTYSNLYPIQEFLIDYGVRLGFTKQLR